MITDNCIQLNITPICVFCQYPLLDHKFRKKEPHCYINFINSMVLEYKSINDLILWADRLPEYKAHFYLSKTLEIYHPELYKKYQTTILLQ